MIELKVGQFVVIYETVTSGTFMGRDDGYPVQRTAIYDSLEDIARDFLKHENFRIFELGKEVDLSRFEAAVGRNKFKEEQKRRDLIKEQIKELQAQLEGTEEKLNNFF